MAEKFVRTIQNISMYKGNLTFVVTGVVWNRIYGEYMPVEFTVTDCRDDLDALGAAMNATCGDLEHFTISECKEEVA